MNRSKTWFITGAARGIGARIVKAALAAGDTVVATARNRLEIVPQPATGAGQLMTLDLDVTQEDQAQAAVRAATARFGGIDVLVNNAGYGQLGLFEESSADEVRQQYATNVFGLLNVTRAALPVMRQQRSGHIFNLSSIAGIRGSAGASLYCSSKHAVEGFSESLSKEVAEFGIRVTIVEPGYFRTDFMDPRSVRISQHAVDDYADLSARLKANFEASNHRQAGDPSRLARVIVKLSSHTSPPLRLAAGSDAVEIIRTKIDALRAELHQWESLSVTTDGTFDQQGR